MSTPFQLQGTLQLPPDVGLPADPLGFSVSSQFDSLAEFVLTLTGAGTHGVGLGTPSAAGLKGLLVKVDASALASPVKLLINGSVTGGIEVSPGGGVSFGSPSPVVGITQLDIVYTTAVTVRIWALG